MSHVILCLSLFTLFSLAGLCLILTKVVDGKGSEVQEMKFIVIPLCLILAPLELSTGHDLPCNVTQAGGLTTYRVPDFQQSQCQCSWSNATNFPLANHGLKTDDRVVNKSDTTLITRECVQKITYRRSCISEGGEREATCETNCTHITGQPPSDVKPESVWLLVGMALLLVVVVVVVFVLCYNHRGAAMRKAPENDPDPATLLSEIRVTNHSTADKENTGPKISSVPLRF